ncbi:MAG: sulfur-carrier protein [Pseudonocardiales bacterium]|jgi:molybdopterin converting factor small subunit|nr:sulfur-carrier protein [Pseudonocardiales bacterium]
MQHQVTVRYWAGARRAAGLASEVLTADTLADLLGQLRARPELAEVVAASSVLVDEVRPSGSDQPLAAGAVVDILPPFAGG